MTTATLQVHRDQVAPTGNTAIDSFSQAMRSAGLHPPAEIVVDGDLHRFASDEAHAVDPEADR